MLVTLLCFHAVEQYYFKQRNIPVFSIGTLKDLSRFTVLSGLAGEVSYEYANKTSLLSLIGLSM